MKVNQLEKKGRLTTKDLDNLDLSAITITDEQIVKNGPREVVECRKVCDLKSDQKDKSSAILIEVIGAWSK